jgi:hypothetical protein
MGPLVVVSYAEGIGGIKQCIVWVQTLKFRLLRARLVFATSSLYILFQCGCTPENVKDVHAVSTITMYKSLLSVQSISKAAIKGYCITKPWTHDAYGSYTAQALAEAEATIDIKEVKGCVGYVY